MPIKKILLLITLMQMALTATASVDSTCEWNWSPTPSACRNLPFLNPDNDSRVNLSLLMVDRGLLSLTPYKDEDFLKIEVPFPIYAGDSISENPKIELKPQLDRLGVKVKSDQVASKEFFSGEGHRCLSNSESSTQIFIDQLITTDLPSAERRSLAQTRVDLLTACEWTEAVLSNILPRNIRTTKGKEFSAYLGGIGHFYSGRFDKAEEAFQGLKNSSQAWLKETAAYMNARNALNEAQKDAFDEFGMIVFEKIDKSILKIAEEKFDQYLTAYPDGVYAASSKGLIRRLYWLGRKSEKLDAEYVSQLNRLQPAQQNGSAAMLINEIDSKLLMDQDSTIKSPLLLAIRDLMWMGRPSTPKLTRDALDNRKVFFENEPKLYQYLQAAFAFYVEGNSERALKLLPNRTPSSPDYLDFGEQILRGISMESKQNWRPAEALWSQLIPRAVQPLQRQQLELVLAMNYERSQRLSEVFAPNSQIKNQNIRNILLRNVADAELLRKQAKSGINQKERDHARTVLLFKEISRGRYADFVNDIKEVSLDASEASNMFRWSGELSEDGYACPSIIAVAEILAKDPEMPKGLNCLGEFIYRKNLDYRILEDSTGNYLGGSISLFKGRLFYRLEAYKKVFGNPKFPTDDKAYALFRAIKCFAPSGNNSCSDAEVDISVRKGWFNQLKTKYSGTIWGKGLKYYW